MTGDNSIVGRGFILSEKDRNTLADLARQAKAAPPSNKVRDLQKAVNPAPPTYWALPPCETGFPAVSRKTSFDPNEPGIKLIAFPVLACIYADTHDGRGLRQLRDPMGNPVRKVVWNYGKHTSEIQPIHQHKNGQWAINGPASLDNTVGSSGTTTRPTPTGTTVPPECAGECQWEADANGVWQWPTGCSDTTTAAPTTSTTGSPTTTTVSPWVPPTTTTTAHPCNKIACYLECYDTGTTVVPGTAHAAYATYRYRTYGTTTCPSPCTCYGNGDPCFLLGGVIESKCVGTYSPTTTTLSPDTICLLADALRGAPHDNYTERWAGTPGDANSWTRCYTCPDDYVPLWPLKGDDYLNPQQGTNTVVVYDTPCVLDPCQNGNPRLTSDPDKVYFRAFDPDTITQPGGAWENLRASHIDQEKILSNYQHYFVDKDDGEFDYGVTLIMWVRCGSNVDFPADSPSPYGWAGEPWSQRFSDFLPGKTFADHFGYQGRYVYDVSNNSWIYEVDRLYYNRGDDCSACGNAPKPKDLAWEIAPTGGATSTSTTSTTSTTRAPCGCNRPNWCPEPFECAKLPCIKGGSIVGGAAPTSTSTTPNPAYPCFPDNTTTSTTTSAPTTTVAAGYCRDTYGTLCHCTSTSSTTSTTTIPTLPGRCPAGTYWVPGSTPCDPGSCVPYPTTTTTQNPHFPCAGYCIWTAPYEGNWIIQSDVCTGESSCQCAPPGRVPASCGDTEYTNCVEPVTTVQPPSSTTTAIPCACCTSTTLPPCEQFCRYKAEEVEPGIWALVIASDPCPTSCPCPTGFSYPVEECDTLKLKCGDNPPPPPTTTPVPILGTCCSWSGCNLMTEDECMSIIGTPESVWIGPSGSCLDCAGRCCRDTNDCIEAHSKSDCDLSGGVWYGRGTRCTGGSPCHTTTTSTTSTTSTTPGPEGACCGVSGGCSTITEAACLASGGGVFMGPGTSCSDPGVCPYGACCSPPGSGYCYQTYSFLCTGVFIGGTCSFAACTTTTTTAGPGTQPCCIDTLCLMMLAADCESSGGTVSGAPGTDCGSVDCTTPAPP